VNHRYISLSLAVGNNGNEHHCTMAITVGDNGVDDDVASDMRSCLLRCVCMIPCNEVMKGNIR
jgi:hypothetical protein